MIGQADAPRLRADAGAEALLAAAHPREGFIHTDRLEKFVHEFAFRSKQAVRSQRAQPGRRTVHTQIPSGMSLHETPQAIQRFFFAGAPGARPATQGIREPAGSDKGPESCYPSEEVKLGPHQPKSGYDARQQDPNHGQHFATGRRGIKIDVREKNVGHVEAARTVGVAGDDDRAVLGDDFFADRNTVRAVVRNSRVPLGQLLA